MTRLTTTQPQVKTEEAMHHDRAVGWGLSLGVTIAVLAAIVILLRRLSRKVAIERANRVIDEAFAELDR